MRRGITILMAAAVLLAANVTAVSAAPPANDRFGQAIRFTAIPFDHSVDTTDATRSASDPECFGDDGHTVWYRFTPSTDGDILATTAGSDYDTTLSVYTGEPGNLEQVDCSGDQVRFTVSAGGTYHIMAGSCCPGTGGNLRLRVQRWARLEIDVELSRGRIDPRIGDVVVRGTISCSRPVSDVGIGVNLRQKRPDEQINTGRGSVSTLCDRTIRRWKVLVAGEWAFRPGWARVLLRAGACRDECATDNVNRVIRLRWIQ